MRLERNEKPTCASVKRANGVLSPSTKINCVNKAEPDIVTLYRRRRREGGAREREVVGAMFPPCVPVASTFQLRPGRRRSDTTGHDYRLVA